MFKIVMVAQGRMIPMPKDSDLALLEACFRADLYAKRNKSATFLVMSEDDDIIYETTMMY